jgi:hypothetical protein
MPFTLRQQYYPGPASASVSGGPVVPTPTHPLIKSAYASLAPADVYLCNFETSRKLTLSGLSGVTLTTNAQRQVDHGMVASPKDSLTAFTASVTGSKSGYYMAVGLLLKNRGFTDGFTGTTTAAVAAAGSNDIGVFTLRKRFFDMGLEKGGLTATVTGVNYSGDSIAGDYYDSGSGQFIQKSTGDTIGAVLVDDGMFVVNSAALREVATAVTGIIYKSKVLATSINVFFFFLPDEMNFTTNFTAAITGTVSSDTTSAGEIQQAYNNLWTKSPLTGSTDRFSYGNSITGAGAGPFITAVGLYNNNNDLMAVAKLARPLKKPTDLPITFKVQIDI